VLLLQLDPLQGLTELCLLVDPAVVELVLPSEEVVVLSERLDDGIRLALPGLIGLDDRCLLGGVTGSGDQLLLVLLLSGSALRMHQLQLVQLLVQLSAVLQRLLVALLDIPQLLPGIVQQLLPLRSLWILWVLPHPILRCVQPLLQLGVLLELVVQEHLVPAPLPLLTPEGLSVQ
jgi:hypothetical protein